MHMVLLCDMHKIMVLCTVSYGGFMCKLNMESKNTLEFEVYNSSPSGKPNIFYLRGARFKPYKFAPPLYVLKCN